MSSWLGEHSFDLISTFGLLAGLLFTGLSFRRDDRSRRVSNLLRLTESHRAIWGSLLQDARLKRVLDPNANLGAEPVTLEEEVFVTLAIQHLSAVFHAIRMGLTISPEGVKRDVWQFFSLPVPQEIWSRVKVLQDNAFVEFIEACRNWK